MSMLSAQYYFATPIYTAEAPEYLQAVREVSEQNLAIVQAERQLDEIYPVYMSGTYHNDPRLADFTKYIANTSRGLLDSQGYNMSNFEMRFSEMWTQEHHKHSAMEQHTHGFGVKIVGFYFLETPAGGSRVVFHDPRPGKVMTDLPEKDVSAATIASQAINFEPKPGLLIFTPSYLAHSFSRHRPEEPIKFVHFNLYPLLLAEATPIHGLTTAPATEIV